MSLTSFSKPSDADVLQKLSEQDTTVSFVGKGSIHQNVSETLYIRTIKIKLNKEEVLKNVIYIKKGITWLFKKIETISVVSTATMIKEKIE
ncbi:MAG: hypothetical protein OEW87_00600 [Flavobacteriaceae bacterium]|nr:hypothetical protein [Flavobacteriaceae bacterium]